MAITSMENKHIRRFNVTIVTLTNTQDDTLPPWNDFLQNDEGETQDFDLPSDMRDKLIYKLSKLPRYSSFARGHPHFVYDFFQISHIMLRGLASRGPLMGTKKSSW
ncbi:hypothetical protein PHAVU_011G109300 [Phaseolus vulgaris]|uniref:Uncharacterized protein n=1 Tax=Phaseolus vulgaris TaxID=3885 RepID=V7AG61_PHAVU|nr:hypothetical protein PHAVU_011G109300g [Phaseolus vulgaris]ESW04602.1 hypothetical protein PHAVU_011G109300g [Phaseolus vulgaris]